MDETPDQVRYRADSKVFGAIGEHIARTKFEPVEVWLPKELADLASAAWQWDDSGTTCPESLEQRLVRGDAADLALIGLSIETNGRVDGDGVIVALDPTLLGAALRAADPRLLVPTEPPSRCFATRWTAQRGPSVVLVRPALPTKSGGGNKWKIVVHRLRILLENTSSKVDN